MCLTEKGANSSASHLVILSSFFLDLWCLRTSCASLTGVVVLWNRRNPPLGSAAALCVTGTAAARPLVPGVATGTNRGLEA